MKIDPDKEGSNEGLQSLDSRWPARASQSCSWSPTWRWEREDRCPGCSGGGQSCWRPFLAVLVLLSKHMHNPITSLLPFWSNPLPSLTWMMSWLPKQGVLASVLANHRADFLIIWSHIMWPLCSKSCNGSCLPQINSQVSKMSPGLHQLSLTPLPTLLTWHPSLWLPGFLRVLRLPQRLCTCYFFFGESFTHWLPPLLQVFALRPSLTMQFKPAPPGTFYLPSLTWFLFAVLVTIQHTIKSTYLFCLSISSSKI